MMQPTSLAVRGDMGLSAIENATRAAGRQSGARSSCSALYGSEGQLRSPTSGFPGVCRRASDGELLEAAAAF